MLTQESRTSLSEIADLNQLKHELNEMPRSTWAIMLPNFLLKTSDRVSTAQQNPGNRRF